MKLLTPEPTKVSSRMGSEGVQGAIGKPPGRARRREIPACGNKQPCLKDKQFGRAICATQHRRWKEQLGGASEDARSLGAGRFAAATLLDFSR